MSIVKNDSADSYVKRPPRDVRFHLVHGIDEGLIHERAKILVATVLGAMRIRFGSRGSRAMP